MTSRSGRRRRARELALRILFELEGTQKDPQESLLYHSADMGATQDIADFAWQLVGGTLREIKVIDEVVAGASSHWALTDIGKVERAILRLSAYELLFESDTPASVVIDEAVELAKAYAGPQPARFINGVLAPIAGQRAT